MSPAVDKLGMRTTLFRQDSAALPARYRRELPSVSSTLKLKRPEGLQSLCPELALGAICALSPPATLLRGPGTAHCQTCSLCCHSSFLYLRPRVLLESTTASTHALGSHSQLTNRASWCPPGPSALSAHTQQVILSVFLSLSFLETGTLS